METDLHLLTRYHRHGDAGAFQQLVESHAGMVHATARRVTQDANLAQDVAQETFLALARSSGAAIQCVGAWLHQVAWQKAKNAIRSETRRQRHESAAAKDLELQQNEEATWVELEPMLDEALQELPDRTRALVIERFMEGRTQQEVAQRRGLSQSTVSRQLTEAIGDLRGCLKSKGLVCGSGFAALFVTHGTQAAPPGLATTLGMQALSGTGINVAAASLSSVIVSLLMKTLSSKLAAAGASLLLFSAVGYDLASDDPWLLRLTRSPAPVAGNAPPLTEEARKRDSKTKTTAQSAPGALLSASAFAGSGPPAQPTGDSVEVRLSKLAKLTKVADFKALIARLVKSKDQGYAAAELQRVMGLTVDPQMLDVMLSNTAGLELGVVSQLSTKHPKEALSWLAMLDGDSSTIEPIVLRAISETPKSLEGDFPPGYAKAVRDREAKIQHVIEWASQGGLPPGPNRDHIMAMLRARNDPVTEAQRLILTTTDPTLRQTHLKSLAEFWPMERMGEGVQWALQNLQGKDLASFLPRFISQMTASTPDAALAALGQIQDPGVLSSSLIFTMDSLVNDHRRTSELISLINKLQGQQRATAISGLTRRWVRVDEEGVMQWINGLETPADFEATLPATLPQLKPENYSKAMDNLMTQLDGTLDKALIKAATPDPLITHKTSVAVDIVHRLTQLPQYGAISSGKSGNQDLLWRAVNSVAERWVTWNRGQPQEAAQWIDSLPFANAADKAVVAARLYNEWKITDPASSAAWAARAGVKVP